MTISKKNFSNMDPALIPVDTEYVSCNFGRWLPDMTGPQPVGVRLFPGDDTPRTFTDCNLLNCEPPPGSTLVRCNTNIIEKNINAHTETVTVDSVVVSSRTFKKSIHHGKYNPQTGSYDYLPSPVDMPEDY